MTTAIAPPEVTVPTTVASRDPATGEVWRTHAITSASAVAHAVADARAAQPAWAALGVPARCRVLTRFRRALHARRAEVAACISRENGKPIVEALGAEVLVALDYARYYAAVAPATLGSAWRTPGSLAMWRKRIRIRHEPYGVVGVVSPWNYPFMLPAGILLPALVGGNAVLLKPSELTTATGMLLVDLLHEAGVPPAACQVLPGDGGTGAALVASAVDKVSFTGSVATGRRVAVACAERLVPCSLELGGSDPAIVLEDADVALTARGLAWARFSNAGQTCVAPKRVLAVGAVHDALVWALAREVRALRLGAGRDADVDVGPLVRPSQVDALRAQLDDALALGATVAAEAAPPSAAPGDASGWFTPTLLAGATPAMRVMREETFGPLLPVMRVRDVDEAVAVANASEFGLSASVWSRDRARALAVALRLEAGTVAINDAAVVAGIAEVPHGGMKASGPGRAHGVAGLLEYVRTKTIVDERVPSLRQAWWFGYGPALRDGIDAVLDLAHGGSVGARLGGAWRARVLTRRPRRD